MNDNQANLIDLSHRTTETIDKLNNKLKDQGVEIIVQSNSAKDLEDNLDDIIKLAITGGLLAHPTPFGSFFVTSN